MISRRRPRCLATALTTVQLVDGQALRWVVAPTKLPAQLWFPSSVYSASEGAIYIAGGDKGNARVAKYSLTSGEIETNGELLAFEAGGDIYYLGGVNWGFNGNISRYSPTTGQRTEVNSIPVGGMSQFATAFNPDSGMLYTFGGFNGRYLNSVLEYNTAINSVMEVGQFPDTLYGATAVYAPDNGLIYIFGGNNGSINTQNAYDIHQFNPATRVVSKLSTRLPRSIFNACAVYANSKAYIFHHGGLVVYNISTWEVEEAQIESSSWPGYLHGASCNFVPELNQIYIFGGHGNFNGNDIAYVQL